MFAECEKPPEPQQDTSLKKPTTTSEPRPHLNLPTLSRPSLTSMFEGKEIYVDKTFFLKSMMNTSKKFHFLARPKRFGKTLLVDTMAEFFAGKKNLFINTYIHTTWPTYSWLKYPTIRLDFSKLPSGSVSEFRISLMDELQMQANNSETARLTRTTVNGALCELISNLYEAYNSSVVILIDEYDSPHTSTRSNKEEAADILLLLEAFVRAVESMFKIIHFCFVTGVTKILLRSFAYEIAADDITTKPHYATIVGFDEDELNKYFDNHIQNVANARNVNKTEILTIMKTWHESFRFASNDVRVYNPCSIINYLASKGNLSPFVS